jgi:hypothetical protein
MAQKEGDDSKEVIAPVLDFSSAATKILTDLEDAIESCKKLDDLVDVVDILHAEMGEIKNLMRQLVAQQNVPESQDTTLMYG